MNCASGRVACANRHGPGSRRRDGDERRAVARDRSLSRAHSRDADTKRNCRWSSTAPKRASPPGTKSFPGPVRQQPGRHGTFQDCEAWLPYIAEMGFDVVYLPPIHPSAAPSAREKITPWTSSRTMSVARGRSVQWRAVISPIHPQLGTLEDFRQFSLAPRRTWARSRAGYRVSMFAGSSIRSRTPGMVPQDGRTEPFSMPRILPSSIRTSIRSISKRSESTALWEELKSVLQFWIDQGVRIFRVDNPHTKAFPFWQWVIGRSNASIPKRIFLAEAFTRPHVMYLAGQARFLSVLHLFCLAEYETGIDRLLHRADANGRSTNISAPIFGRPRPIFCPSSCKSGGRAAFMIRLVLAATLGASYGIYGPAFELCENHSVAPGSEEYLNSEKYELKHRELNSSLRA